MLYYRVKNKYDNKNRYKYARGGGLACDGIYIGGELFTPAEVKKEYNSHLVGLALEELFDAVDVSRKSVYFFFGARFSTELSREADV